VIHVQVLCFGVLKDWFGAPVGLVELPEGATVAALLEHLTATHSIAVGPGGPQSGSQSWAWTQGIAVSVNAEYVTKSQVLHEGDEVGLLPPVSGGAADRTDAQTEIDPELFPFQGKATALTLEPIDTEKIVAAAKRGEDGAVVIFDGIVRNHTRGRQTLYLDYEAYNELATRQMAALVGEAIKSFGVRDAWIIHRLGRLMVGETSVLIVVASTHRAQAFEACRWLIDTLKKTVPIWKKETFADGAVWAASEPFPAELAVEPEASHEG
jgi:molybdopterin synthase catalytic subunit